MLRKILTIPLLVLMLLNMSQQTFIYWVYQLNQDFVAAYLCENNYRVEQLCGGRCVLVKGFEIIGDYDNSLVKHTLSVEKAEQNLFVLDLKDDIDFLITEKRLDNSFFLPIYDFNPFDSLLRPPNTQFS